ncbi:MAG: uroporphyrinogen decarboxylase family protein [Planctomycetota bacterium]|jgi:uroporphyrinogen decarboxylase
MKEMTSHERFQCMFEHREADRIAIVDTPWPATIERWESEGLPKDADFRDYFALDYWERVELDNSPRYEKKVIEETDEHVVYTSRWGATLKEWKHAESTPEFLDFTIVDRESWAKAKARMKPTRDRIDWADLKKNYAAMREKGFWIELGFWFGFDVTHSWSTGTERVLMALIDDPEWCVEMFNHYLDVDIALAEMLLAEGYTFDAIHWYDDLGYKHNQFMSLNMFRELVKPVHKRACEWAHSHGMKTHLHSCGDVRPFVPEWVEIGVDCLNPLEVKAGMDPIALKRQYGEKLVLHGGINAVLWDDLAAIEAEMRAVIPTLKENGGYIFSTDHSVPSSVSADDFRQIVELAKELGSY